MKDFTYLLISDIHLGHNTNKTENIVNNLKWFFTNYKNKITKADMIIIAGDVFDKLLTLNSKDSILAYNWLSTLAMFCKNFNIKLRILEGTPSHDWKQVKLLDSMLSTLEITDLDYKYFDILDIEYIEKYDMHILYLPDEWKDNAELIYKDVTKILKKHKLDKVDIIVMHGAFRYQIPNVESDQFHVEDDYLNICRYTVNCGHVHIRSQYDRILVPGSFDRLTHADENIKKGGLLVTIKDGKFKYEFLENKKALYFTTIDISNLSIEKIEHELKKISSKHAKAYVRLLNTNVDNKYNFMVNDLKSKYKNLNITVTNKIEDNIKITKRPVVKHTNLVLDKDTIKRMVTDEINQLSISTEERDMILEELDNILLS